MKNIADELNIEEEINLEFLKNNLFEILDQMDLKYKEVLVLKFWEQKSYSEISDILKKPEGTVATLINRAKKHFLKILEKSHLKI